jgi:predicted phage terminase large subunit-like protein
MSVASAKIEAGQVFFPSRAPWLACLEEELLTFPHGRHDDQVDSISQALNNPGYSYDTSLSWVE